jgi:hypothetical protein
VLLLVLDQIILKDLLIFQRSSISRKTPLESGSTSTREKLADFSAQTYGVRWCYYKKINYFISSLRKTR